MSRPRLLDLFCGAGGAAVGYHRAGFDVVGVDIAPQPHYPFEFHQADATAYPLAGFDAIHASPPCQADSLATLGQRRAGQEYPQLIPATRRLLEASGKPWVIENVPGAPIRPDYRLCGCMFGLSIARGQLVRQRWFETSWRGFDLRPPCCHAGPALSVVGHGTPSWSRRLTGHVTVAERRELLGAEWMNRAELSQAIPPAYTEYIGAQLFDALRQAA